MGKKSTAERKPAFFSTPESSVELKTAVSVVGSVLDKDAPEGRSSIRIKPGKIAGAYGQTFPGPGREPTRVTINEDMHSGSGSLKVGRLAHTVFHELELHALPLERAGGGWDSKPRMAYHEHQDMYVRGPRERFASKAREVHKNLPDKVAKRAFAAEFKRDIFSHAMSDAKITKASSVEVIDWAKTESSKMFASTKSRDTSHIDDSKGRRSKVGSLNKRERKEERSTRGSFRK